MDAICIECNNNTPSHAQIKLRRNPLEYCQFLVFYFLNKFFQGERASAAAIPYPKSFKPVPQDPIIMYIFINISTILAVNI
jgi:hypothetical protein